MTRSLGSRWLLALCGVFCAAVALVNLLTRDLDGAMALRRFAGTGAVTLQGGFALAAGVCAIAAGLWSAWRNRFWALAANGLALAAFGVLCLFLTRRRMSFLPVALLLIVMAVSVAILAGSWLLGAAAALAVAFAVSFLVVGLGWVRLEQPGLYFVWMFAWFGFCALCMIGMGLRPRVLDI